MTVTQDLMINDGVNNETKNDETKNDEIKIVKRPNKWINKRDDTKEDRIQNALKKIKEANANNQKYSVRTIADDFNVGKTAIYERLKNGCIPVKGKPFTKDEQDEILA